MLKFSKNYYFSKKKKGSGTFSFFWKKSSKLINYSREMCWNCRYYNIHSPLNGSMERSCNICKLGIYSTVAMSNPLQSWARGKKLLQAESAMRGQRKDTSMLIWLHPCQQWSNIWNIHSLSTLDWKDNHIHPWRMDQTWPISRRRTNFLPYR